MPVPEPTVPIVRPALARLLAAAALACAACSSGGGGRFASGGYLTGRNYSYAVYDARDSLLHTPIDHLRREMTERAKGGVRAISDVFVLTHGWNFTVEESFELYEGYRHSLEPMLDQLRTHDPGFEPYFIYVVWSSVSRPVTDAVRSVLPWTPPAWIEGTTRAVDALAFHFPSNWGESQDASRIALGPPARWDDYRPERDPAAPTEYARAIDEGLARAAKRGFRGFDAPLSVLIGELIRIRRGEAPAGPAGPRLHVVGHSFGGKLASLATYDAVTRAAADELVRPATPGAPAGGAALVDSLIMILPAMQVSEMFWELDLDLPDAELATLRDQGLLRKTGPVDSTSLRFDLLARRIGTKALVYSKHDSANGWLFAIGDFIIDHDAIAEAQKEVIRWRPLDRLVYGDEERPWWGQAVAAPFAAIYGTVQLAGRATYAVLGTVFSDLSALLDGPVAQCGEIVHDWPNVPHMLADVALLPISPLTVQRSAGNQGLRHVRARASLFNLWTWLDDDAVEWLEDSRRINSDQFLALSSAPGAAIEPPLGEHYAVCDAKQVYDGALANSPAWIGAIANFVPPGAHGDVRSMDAVGDPAHPDGLEKRLRTFLFVYNLTRGAARAAP